MKQHLYRMIALCLALCILLAAAAFATEEPAASSAQEEESVAVETEALFSEESPGKRSSRPKNRRMPMIIPTTGAVKH